MGTRKSMMGESYVVLHLPPDISQPPPYENRRRYTVPSTVHVYRYTGFNAPDARENQKYSTLFALLHGSPLGPRARNGLPRAPTMSCSSFGVAGAGVSMCLTTTMWSSRSSDCGALPSSSPLAAPVGLSLAASRPSATAPSAAPRPSSPASATAPQRRRLVQPWCDERLGRASTPRAAHRDQPALGRAAPPPPLPPPPRTVSRLAADARGAPPSLRAAPPPSPTASRRKRAAAAAAAAAAVQPDSPPAPRVARSARPSRAQDRDSGRRCRLETVSVQWGRELSVAVRVRGGGGGWTGSEAVGGGEGEGESEGVRVRVRARYGSEGGAEDRMRKGRERVEGGARTR